MSKTASIFVRVELPVPDSDGRCHLSCPFNRYSCRSGSYWCPAKPECGLGVGEIYEDCLHTDEYSLGVEKRVSLGFHMKPGKDFYCYGIKGDDESSD